MMRFVVFFAIAFFHIVSGETNCSNLLGAAFYRDMDCQAIGFDQTTKCPNKFSCPSRNESSEWCYYKNETYKIGEQFKNPLDFCQQECKCVNGTEGAKFECTLLECLQFWKLPLNIGCQRKYDLNSCCFIEENCGGSKPEFECHYEGKTYGEGERFSADDFCVACVCKRGFAGKLEKPYCIPKLCNVELFYQDKLRGKCAPAYTRSILGDFVVKCCPNDWICPSGKEVITGTPTSDDECQFGNKTLKVGQHFNAENKRKQTLNCKCEVPPFVSCT